MAGIRFDSPTMGQYVDRRILDKIYELASHNVTNVAEIKRCLDRYVENKVFGVVAGAKKPKKTNRRYIIHPAKISETTLHGQFLHRSTVTTIKSLSASRFVVGKKDFLKRGSSKEQETIFLPHLIQQGKTPLKRVPSFCASRAMAAANVRALR